MAKATTATQEGTAKMSLADFKAALEQGTFQDFGTLFNEQTQTSYTARVFNRLKFEPQIAKLLFVPLMISIPFNPLTGEMEDNGYNSRRKYRPFIRPDQFLMNIKALCHEDEALKKRYMDYAGFTGKWDTKETAEFTDTDRSILFIYRRPMTATHPAVRINSQSVTGERYGGQFLLQTKQDAMTGEFIGDISNLHKLGLLSNALARLEVNSFNTALTEQKADCISLDLGRSFITSKTFTEIKDLDSNEAKTVRGQIRSCYPLGSVAPLLVTPMISMDVEAITGSVKTFVPDPENEGNEIEQLLPQFRNPVNFDGSLIATDKYAVLDKINAVVGNAFPKDPSRKKERNVDADVYPNFVILEYITDNDTAVFTNDTDRNMAAQKMEAKTERTPLFHRKKGWADPELADFMERISAFYDFAQKDSFNKRMPELMMANYKTATEVIEDRALKIFAETFNLGEEYKELFNPEVLATHKDIIMEMWPDDFADKFDTIVDKIEDGEGNFANLLEEASEVDTPVDQEEAGGPDIISADEVEI